MTFRTNIERYFLNLSGTNHDNWTVNPFTLAFTGPYKKYEKRFLVYHNHSSLKPFRISILTGVLFYTLFFWLDIQLFPDLKKHFMILRFFIINPLLLVLLLLSYNKKFKKHIQLILSAAIFIASTGIIVMVIMTAKVFNNYSYYAGTMLVLFFGYSFSRIRFIYGLATAVLIALTFETGSLFFSDIPFNVFINNNFFFISTIIVGLVNAYYLEFSARRNFLLRVMLENERRKVMEANSGLEKRVEEKTQQLIKTNEKLKKEILARDHYKSEKTLLEEELFQLHKMETIGTLAEGIAHDFNNILTPIIGSAGMAMDELPDSSPAKEDLEQIKNAANRGKKIVQQILTFSRQMDFDKTPVRLEDVVNESINLLKISKPENVKINKTFEKGYGTVLADKTQMNQVIMNLAVNAFHAMKETGGILSITLSNKYIDTDKLTAYPKTKPGNFVVITVSDTGHGMDKETQYRIFEPFFTKKEVGEGTGLGLSVVHGIIKNHGGFIEVESEPGEGSIFRVFLPDFPEESKGEKKNRL
ncbi:MAG: hypothetical protein GXO47_06945 [Chlorobi bacterium]|nr:hypothetical protein [Chlorobiota bacterium]